MFLKNSQCKNTISKAHSSVKLIYLLRNMQWPFQADACRKLSELLYLLNQLKNVLWVGKLWQILFPNFFKFLPVYWQFSAISRHFFAWCLIYEFEFEFFKKFSHLTKGFLYVHLEFTTVNSYIIGFYWKVNCFFFFNFSANRSKIGFL